MNENNASRSSAANMKPLMLVALLSSAFVLVACAKDAQPSTPASAAASAADAGLETTAATAVNAPACTTGQDQTCNDNPSISSLHGKCSAQATCECVAPFTKLASGRCS